MRYIVLLWLALALALLIFLLGSLFYVMASFGWKYPWFAVFLGPVVLAVTYVIRRQRRIELDEMARFQQRPRLAGAPFLTEIGVDPLSPDAELALGARRVFAELGSVPDDSLHAFDRFYPDMEKLPFYDRVDALAIIIELEAKLKFRSIIPKDDATRILSKVLGEGKLAGHESGTVGEAVLEVLRAWHNQPKGE